MSPLIVTLIACAFGSLVVGVGMGLCRPTSHRDRLAYGLATACIVIAVLLMIMMGT